MPETPEPTPHTPGIREVRTEMSSENFGFCTQNNGTNKLNLRAEIDTSPPFGSVKEAVTKFGGSGSWMPCYKGFDDIDIKKVEEQAAELEKDLIVKELETLDVLEELGTTKKIVEDLKRQLQREALRCMTIPFPDEQMSSPAIKKMNKQNYSFHVNKYEQRVGSFSPCLTSSPDMILMELKQAKLNLGKTINELGVIQTSVEYLNKKMKKEKTFLKRTRERLTSKFAGVLSLEEELKQARLSSPIGGNIEINYQAEQLKKVDEAENTEAPKLKSTNAQSKSNLKTAELRLLAAKKMEEAARAAEAVALAEIKFLSSNDSTAGFVLPQPEKFSPFGTRSPLNPKAHKLEGLPKNKIEIPKIQKHDTTTSVLKKLREATEEVKLSKQALEEALNKVEMANRKQYAAEEAFRKWIPEDHQEGSQAAYYATRLSNIHFHQPDHHHQDFQLNELRVSDMPSEETKPVFRSTVSMQDVLSRKQVLPQDYVAARPTEARNEGQKVALSQMLHDLREDLSFHPRPEKDGGEQKQFYTQRRKFGFIHISLPMTKLSKKKEARFD